MSFFYPIYFFSPRTELSFLRQHSPGLQSGYGAQLVMGVPTMQSDFSGLFHCWYRGRIHGTMLIPKPSFLLFYLGPCWTSVLGSFLEKC